MTSESLQGKTAVITGASSGIGEATARGLAAQGANLALLPRRDAIPVEDVADVIVFAVARPARTSLSEILIRPTSQTL